jgi:hypothetical protein
MSQLSVVFWAAAVGLLFVPIAAGRLSGVTISRETSERLEVVASGMSALEH